MKGYIEAFGLLAARHSLPYTDPMFRPEDLIVRTLDPFKDPIIARFPSSTLLPFFFLGSPIPNQVVGKLRRGYRGT